MLLSCRFYIASWLPGQHQQADSDISVRASLLRGRADSGRAPRRSKRPTPGFRRQFGWCLSRVALQRTREPLIVVTDYAIFALTGQSWLLQSLTVFAAECIQKLLQWTFSLLQS